MTIYILLIVFNYISIYAAGRSKRKEVLYSFLLLATMCAMCACRDLYCGTDTLNYKRIYDSLLNLRESESLFIWALNTFSTFRGLLVFFALATYIPLFLFIKKETLYCCLAVLVFMVSPNRLFPETFNIIRQALAASLVLGGFIFWFHKKRLYSLGLILIATLFHTSSLIALPFLFLPKKSISYKWSLILLISSVVLSYMGSLTTFIQNFITSTLGNLNIDFLGSALEHYSHYGAKNIRELNIVGLSVRLLPVSLLCFLAYPRTEEGGKSYGFYYNIFLIGTVLGNIFLTGIAWGIRIMFSIAMIQVLVVPLAYQYADRRYRTYINWILLFLSVSYIFYLISLPETGTRPIVPYKAFFE